MLEMEDGVERVETCLDDRNLVELARGVEPRKHIAAEMSFVPPNATRCHVRHDDCGEVSSRAKDRRGPRIEPNEQRSFPPVTHACGAGAPASSAATTLSEA